MSDPFLNNQNSYSEKEIFRLRSENKQLRVELSRLRVLLEHSAINQLSDVPYSNESFSSRQCRLSNEQSKGISVPKGTEKNNSLEELNTTHRLSTEQTEEKESSLSNNNSERELSTDDKKTEHLEENKKHKSVKEVTEEKKEGAHQKKTPSKTQSSECNVRDNMLNNNNNNKSKENSNSFHPEHEPNIIIKMLEASNVDQEEPKEVNKLKRELNILNTHFEAFIVEVTEREIAYQEVYKEIYNEITEEHIRCDALQRQVSELSASCTILQQKLHETELRGGEDKQREEQKQQREQSFSDSHRTHKHGNLPLNCALSPTSPLSRTLLLTKDELELEEEEEEEQQIKILESECEIVKTSSPVISKHQYSASQILEKEASWHENINEQSIIDTSLVKNNVEQVKTENNHKINETKNNSVNAVQILNVRKTNSNDARRFTTINYSSNNSNIINSNNDNDKNVKQQVVLQGRNNNLEEPISSERQHISYVAPSRANNSFTSSSKEITENDNTVLTRQLNIPSLKERALERESAQISKVAIPLTELTQTPSELHIPKGAAALRDMYMTNECKLASTQTQHRSRKQRGLTESSHYLYKQNSKSKLPHDSNATSAQIIIPKMQNNNGTSAEDTEKDALCNAKRKRARRTSLSTLSASSSCSSESSLFTRFSRRNHSETSSASTSAVHVAPSLLSLAQSASNANNKMERCNTITEASMSKKHKTEIESNSQVEPLTVHNFKSSDVHFGINPIADYLKLENNVSSNRERQLLQEQLLKFYSYSFVGLSESALRHLDMLNNSSIATTECLPEL